MFISCHKQLLLWFTSVLRNNNSVKPTEETFRTQHSSILSYRYFDIPYDMPLLAFCFPVKLSLQKQTALCCDFCGSYTLTVIHTKTTVISLSQSFLTCHAVCILLDKLLVTIFAAFYAISRFTSMLTWLSSETHQFSPHSPILHFKINFNVLLPFMLQFFNHVMYFKLVHP